MDISEIYYGILFFTLALNPKPFSSHLGGWCPPNPRIQAGGASPPPDPPNGGLRAAIKSAKFVA